MKHDIDQKIERLARLTHSPRGRYADRSQLYADLLHRINLQPAATSRGSHPDLLPRWWRAASVVLLVVGVATASVLLRQNLFSPSSSPAENGLEPTDGTLTPYTLSYQEAPLSQIVAELSTLYNTPILISDETLATFCITATFSTDEPLGDILQVLADVSGCELQKSDSGYLLIAK